MKLCITHVCTVVLDDWARRGEEWARAGGIIAKVFLGKNYGQIMYHTCLYDHFRTLGEGWAQGGGRGRAGSSPKCSWEKTTVKSCITLVCTVILDNWARMGEGWGQGEGEGGRDHRQSVPGEKLRSNHVSYLSVRSF